MVTLDPLKQPAETQLLLGAASKVNPSLLTCKHADDDAVKPVLQQLNNLGFPIQLKPVDLESGFIDGQIAEFIDKQVLPGPALEPEQLLEWFNECEEDPIMDTRDIFEEVAGRKKLLNIMENLPKAKNEDLPDEEQPTIETLVQVAN